MLRRIVIASLLAADMLMSTKIYLVKYQCLVIFFAIMNEEYIINEGIDKLAAQV